MAGEWHGQVCGMYYHTAVLWLLLWSALPSLPHLYAVLFLACARDACATKNKTNFHLWEKIATAQSCSVG